MKLNYNKTKIRGRGIEKICDACKAEGLPMPEFTVNPGDIMVKFTGSEDSIVNNDFDLSDKLSEKLSDKLSEKLSEKLSDNEQKTLKLLLEDPGYTTSTISQKREV